MSTHQNLVQLLSVPRTLSQSARTSTAGSRTVLSSSSAARRFSCRYRRRWSLYDSLRVRPDGAACRRGRAGRCQGGSGLPAGRGGSGRGQGWVREASGRVKAAGWPGRGHEGVRAEPGRRQDGSGRRQGWSGLGQESGWGQGAAERVRAGQGWVR